MEPIFTLPYSEYAVATEMAKKLKPKHGYSVLAPLSRQQKGIDLLVRYAPVGSQPKMASIQVKSSRSYDRTPVKTSTGESKPSFGTWFKKFDISHPADFYAFVYFWPGDVDMSRRKVKPEWWNRAILIFNHREMQDFLSNLRTKKGNPDSAFSFVVIGGDEVVLTRGDETRSKKDFSGHLFEKRVDSIKKFLCPNAQ